MVPLHNSCDLQQLMSDRGITARNQHFLNKIDTAQLTPSDRPGLCVLQGDYADSRQQICINTGSTSACDSLLVLHLQESVLQ
jgi:hypothetical protein